MNFSAAQPLDDLALDIPDDHQQTELTAGSTGLSLSKVGLTVLQVLMAFSVGVIYYETNIEENHSELKAINAAFINVLLNYFFIEIADTLIEMFPIFSPIKKTDLEQFLCDAEDPLVVRSGYDFKIYKPVVVGLSFFGALCSSMLAFNAGADARQELHGWWGGVVEGCNYGNLLVNVCFLYSVDIFHELMAFRLEKNNTQIALEGIKEIFQVAIRTEDPHLATNLCTLLSYVKFQGGANKIEDAKKLNNYFKFLNENKFLSRYRKRNTLAVFKKDPDRSYGRAIFSGVRYFIAKLS
jgi:hypothetical protein